MRLAADQNARNWQRHIIPRIGLGFRDAKPVPSTASYRSSLRDDAIRRYLFSGLGKGAAIRSVYWDSQITVGLAACNYGLNCFTSTGPNAGSDMPPSSTMLTYGAAPTP